MKIKNIISALCLLGFLALIIVANPPQQSSPPTNNGKNQAPKTPKSPDEDLKLATELVQFDAVVTDKDGKAVTTLNKEDFEVLENGQPQTLSFFASEIRKPIDDLAGLDLKRPAQTLDKDALPNNVESGRVILIIIDTLHIAIENFTHARDSLIRFIDEDVLDGDRVAIVTTGGGIGLLQQLTDDKNVMRTALSRMQLRTPTSDLQYPPISLYHAQLIQQGDKEALDVAIQATLKELNLQSGQNGTQIAAAIVRGRANEIVNEGSHFAVGTLTTLQNLIRSMQSIKGRKLALMVSDGFPLSSANDDSRARLLDVVDAATKAGVVIYSLDSRGLYAPNMGDISQRTIADNTGTYQRIRQAEQESQKDVLNALASDTGGFALFNNNNFEVGLKKAINDNSAYYVLAYYPPVGKADGRLREIKLRVKGHPEYKIRTKRGYYAPGHRVDVARLPKDNGRGASPQLAGAPDNSKAEQEVRDSLASPVQSTGLGLTLGLNFIDLPQKGAMTMVDLAINPQNLQFNKTDVAAQNAIIAKNTQPAGGATPTGNPSVANNSSPASNTSSPPNQESNQTKPPVDPAKTVEEQARPLVPDERYASTVDIYVLAFGNDGKAVKSFTKEVKMNLRPRTYDMVTESGFYYHDAISLSPGTYYVRLAARQRETGLIGTTSGWIDVPDLGQKKLALSGIFLRPHSPDEDDGPTPESKPENTKVYSTSQADHRIPEGSELDLYTVIYNAQPAPEGKANVVVQTQIFRDNVVVYGSPLRAIAEDTRNLSRIPYGVRLTLKDFKPGHYVLQFTAIDRIAKTTASQRITFEIEE